MAVKQEAIGGSLLAGTAAALAIMAPGATGAPVQQGNQNPLIGEAPAGLMPHATKGEDANIYTTPARLSMAKSVIGKFCVLPGTPVFTRSNNSGPWTRTEKPNGQYVKFLKEMTVSGTMISSPKKLGNFGVKMTTGFPGRVVFENASPKQKGPVTEGACAPKPGVSPGPGIERFPGDDPESSTGGSIVVTDENNDGAISYKGKIIFRPVCDDDTGLNPATVEGFAAFGKGIPVLGAKANLIAFGGTASLFGQPNPQEWKSVDTTNQTSVPFVSTEINRREGAELRLTARISTNLGAVNIILKQSAEDCLGRDDSGEGPSISDPDIGGDPVE